MKTICSFFSACRFISLFLISTIFLLLLYSCSKQDKLSIVEFEGAETVYNYSKSLTNIVSDSLNPPAALINRHDLLEFDCGGSALYLITEGSYAGKVQISGNDTAWFINDKLHSLNITDSLDPNPWLMSKNQKDLSHLQLVNVDRNLHENDIPFLKKLAEIKPNAGFVFLNDEDKIEDIARMFKPRYLLKLILYNNNIHLLVWNTSGLLLKRKI